MKDFSLPNGMVMLCSVTDNTALFFSQLYGKVYESRMLFRFGETVQKFEQSDIPSTFPNRITALEAPAFFEPF